MASKKNIFCPQQLTGKTIEKAINEIESNVYYTGTTKFYWLSVSTNFDNVIHYIRFPYGKSFYMEYDNGIITKVY